MYKESIFPPKRLKEAVKRLSDDLGGFARHPLGLSQRPKSGAALLVVDMQRYFLDPRSHAFIPGALEVLPNILQLVAAFRQASLPVLFTRHGNRAEDAGAMMRWWGGVLETHSAYWALHEDISALAAEEDLIDKSRYDAFFGTDLHGRFQSAGVTEIHVCGVMTHLCCETTARSAFVLDYDVVVVADATASYNYALHLGSLRNLAQGFARIAWSGEYPR